MKCHFPSLKPGDTVALACASSRCYSEQDPMATKTYLEAQGFRVVYREECYSYVSVVKKAQIFLDYLLDDQIKMIWALRGGEGCADLLPMLEAHKADIQTAKPTLLFGFSDFTAVLNYFMFRYDWPVVHGMVAVQFVRDFVDEQSNTLSLSVVRGETGYCIDDLRPLNQAGIAFQAIQAVCCGGNLALLNISIGDLWQFDPADKIVIIEDVGEIAYQLIRTLKYLQRIGFFKKAKAVIFGDFNGRLRGTTAAEQEKERDDIKRYLGYFAESLNFPVLHTNKIGHGAINYPVIFNYPAVLSADGRLSFKCAKVYLL